jgi:hypothetical protein
VVFEGPEVPFLMKLAVARQLQTCSLMNTFEHDPALTTINGTQRPPFIHALGNRKPLALVLVAAVMFGLLGTLATKVYTQIVASHTPRQENDCCSLSLFRKGQWHWRNDAWHCDTATTCTAHTSPFLR